MTWQTLTETLAELERTDPVVSFAAASYDATVTRILRGNSHRMPCTDTRCSWHHTTKGA